MPVPMCVVGMAFILKHNWQMSVLMPDKGGDVKEESFWVIPPERMCVYA